MNRIPPRLRRAPATLAVALSLCAAGATGCGSSGPEMGRVYGTVTLNGKPVTKGTVSFVTTSPEGRNATGTISEDGSYTLQTENPGDGALLGDYKVGLVSREDVLLDYIPKKPIPPKRLIPEKYENPNTSGLTAKVESGSNTKDFALTD
ncbi:hypothetical protein [Paludisphaera rhizosphaerae]|uniref:hypothetical protein n=1 Tax=Paludisphaera rhizosphaerae TaxID=2711216 RepID=UPI0013EC1D6A|nr:hypothetical protein [Paludisphaera rhizosphaerae]